MQWTSRLVARPISSWSTISFTASRSTFSKCACPAGQTKAMRIPRNPYSLSPCSQCPSCRLGLYRAGREFDEPVAGGVADEVRVGRELHLLHQPRAVCADGLWGEAQRFRDFLDGA